MRRIVLAFMLLSASPAVAQEFEFRGPGFEFGNGHPEWHHHYRDEGRHWGWHRERRWDWEHRHHHWRRHWDED